MKNDLNNIYRESTSKLIQITYKFKMNNLQRISQIDNSKSNNQGLYILKKRKKKIHKQNNKIVNKIQMNNLQRIRKVDNHKSTINIKSLN